MIVSRVAPQFNVSDLDWTQLSKKECIKYGGSLVGKACKYVPDLALMSFILFFGTYSMTVTLKKFKFSRYFPTKVRTRPDWNQTGSSVPTGQPARDPSMGSFYQECTKMTCRSFSYNFIDNGEDISKKTFHV